MKYLGEGSYEGYIEKTGCNILPDRTLLYIHLRIGDKTCFRFFARELAVEFREDELLVSYCEQRFLCEMRGLAEALDMRDWEKGLSEMFGPEQSQTGQWLKVKINKLGRLAEWRKSPRKRVQL